MLCLLLRDVFDLIESFVVAPPHLSLLLFLFLWRMAHYSCVYFCLSTHTQLGLTPPTVALSLQIKQLEEDRNAQNWLTSRAGAHLFPAVLLPPMYPESVVDVSVDSACPPICSALNAAMASSSLSEEKAAASSSSGMLSELKEPTQPLLATKRFASPSCESAALMNAMSSTLLDQERKTLEKQQQQQQFNEGFETLESSQHEQQQQPQKPRLIPQMSIPLFAGDSSSSDTFSPSASVVVGARPFSAAAASSSSVPPPPPAATAATAMPDWEREARESAGAHLAQLRQLSMLLLLSFLTL